MTLTTLVVTITHIHQLNGEITEINVQYDIEWNKERQVVHRGQSLQISSMNWFVLLYHETNKIYMPADLETDFANKVNGQCQS